MKPSHSDNVYTFKGVLKYLEAHAKWPRGIPVSERTLWKWAKRKERPLPIHYFSGTPYASTKELDQFVEEMEGYRRRSRAA